MVSSCVRVFLHLPRGSAWHLPLTGSLCSRHPKLFSKSAAALSTMANSFMLTTAGSTSSASPYTM